MSATDERIELIESILENKISKKQVEIKMNDIESKYGEYAFKTFTFQKEEKPWNKGYYDKLRNLSLSGAGSKEFILHLVDVRDELNKFNRMGLIPVVVIAIIVVIVVFIWSC